MRKGLWLGMRSPFSAEIVSSRNLTLVHRREHINEVQSGTTKRTYTTQVGVVVLMRILAVRIRWTLFDPLA
jgi:hypothetical protein